MTGELRKTVFGIPKMDCPSEERLIRMTLDGFKGIQELSFDLEARSVTAIHEGEAEQLLSKLQPLGFGAVIKESVPTAAKPSDPASVAQDESETRVLKQLLGVNATMFVVEIVVGVLAQSTGLIADSLDMFADAAVYGLSLYAVGKSPSLKVRSARLTGYLQLLLAGGTLFEVVRRTFHGSEPMGGIMMGLSAVALGANVFCLVLLTKHRTGGVHMRATYICSSTDVIANAGVIVAGLLVSITGSAIPDLLIGGIISIVVAAGGIRILRVAR